MCSDYDRLEMMVTPRYSTEVLGGMVCPNKLRLVFVTHLERLIRRSWVLEWLIGGEPVSSYPLWNGFGVFLQKLSISTGVNRRVEQHVVGVEDEFTTG